MRIINGTHWRTDHLRAFAARVTQERLGPADRKDLVVEFVPARGRSVTGYAYNRKVWLAWPNRQPVWYMKIKVPTNGGLRRRILNRHPHLIAKPVVDRVDLAATIGHEVGHFGGAHNRHLRGSERSGFAGSWRERYAWAEQLPLEEKPARAKPPVADREARRVREYERKVGEWTTRVKRGQTALTRWKRRLALAQKRLGKAASPR